jgi:hypothetical protein
VLVYFLNITQATIERPQLASKGLMAPIAYTAQPE